MHFSGWLVLGIILVLPWLISMLRHVEARTGNVDPLDSRNILFWLFLFGVMILAVGIGISFAGRR